MTSESRTQLDALIWLSNEAFEGDPDQSLFANLKDLQLDDWTALPAGGGRSIASILEHVGWSKWMYENFAFDGGTLRGDQPPMVPPDGERARPRDELLAWIREGHARWLHSLASLPGDRALDELRPTNWGDQVSTRIQIRVLIAHDYYHAGEINHLRAILHGTDSWPYDES